MTCLPKCVCVEVPALKHSTRAAAEHTAAGWGWEAAEHGFGTSPGTGTAATAGITQATTDSATPHLRVWGLAAAIFPAQMGVEGVARRMPVGPSLDISRLTTWPFSLAQVLLVTYFWGHSQALGREQNLCAEHGRGLQADLLSHSRLLCRRTHRCPRLQGIRQRPGGGRQPARAPSQLGRPMRPRAPSLPRAPDARPLPSPRSAAHRGGTLCPGLADPRCLRNRSRDGRDGKSLFLLWWLFSDSDVTFRGPQRVRARWAHLQAKRRGSRAQRVLSPAAGSGPWRHRPAPPHGLPLHILRIS